MRRQRQAWGQGRREGRKKTSLASVDGEPSLPGRRQGLGLLLPAKLDAIVVNSSNVDLGRDNLFTKKLIVHTRLLQLSRGLGVLLL